MPRQDSLICHPRVAEALAEAQANLVHPSCPKAKQIIYENVVLHYDKPLTNDKIL